MRLFSFLTRQWSESVALAVYIARDLFHNIGRHRSVCVWATTGGTLRFCAQRGIHSDNCHYSRCALMQILTDLLGDDASCLSANGDTPLPETLKKGSWSMELGRYRLFADSFTMKLMHD
jgi:hypothetical protein